MSIFNPKSWKRFTSATELLDWRPVNAEGLEEPKAVFDPLVWRQLLESDEASPGPKPRNRLPHIATG